MLKWRTFAVVAMFAGAIAASAQVERVLPRKGSSSLEGTEFVISYLQNEILEIGTDPRLQIFISSQYDAIVTIDYPLVGGQIRRIAANTVFVEDVSPYHVVYAAEFPQRKAIFIRSDVPIVVYVLNTLAASTDSYTAIPVKHLGTQYLTVNRPNDRYRLNPASQNPLDTMIRSSEFMVIAPQDYTNVEITPTVNTERGSPANQPINVTLHRGECYVVRSAQTPIGTGDLSGSRIRSNLPVAVLSGHVRASIPTDPPRSKDHLVEMLPPMQKWGKAYATTPFAMVYGGDIVRLMSADVDTEVEIITPTSRFTRWFTNAGEWADLTISEPALYRCSKPFFVMQFMPSRQAWGSTDYDPAMVVVPPIEQYVTGALLQFPLLEIQQQLGSTQKFYHYVNIVAEEQAVSTLMINDKYVKDLEPRIDTQWIPGSTLKWAQVRLSPGSYTISSDSGVFSGVMYGTTNADSYANLFGVSYDPVKRDDNTPPKYALKVDCGNVSGTITDVSLDTALLTEVNVQGLRTYNYRWIIGNALDSVGTRDFSATVRDMWQDGQIVIHSYDRTGNGREWLFKYDAPNVEVPESFKIEAIGFARACRPVVIHNRDSTPVTVYAVNLLGDSRLSLATVILNDTIIPAFDSIEVLVCYQPTTNVAPATGTVTVDLGCGRLKTVPIQSSSLASITTRDLDFGPVRIGDTACAPFPIINEGSVPIIISSLITVDLDSAFTPLLSGVSFPDTLLPGDTLWITVCFTPDTVALYERADTVVSDPVFGLVTRWKGRGVRPDVPDMIVDWGRRRVGSVLDTVIALRNRGEANCIVTLGTPIHATPEFSSTAFGTAIAVKGLTDEVLALRFEPVVEGLREDTVYLLVDWRFHVPVRLILRGEGILPSITTVNLDMGDVVINTSKDSVLDLVFTAGTESLTVFSSQLTGADIPSFVIPDTLQRLTWLPVGSSVGGQVTFTPSRLGIHRMEIVLEHDAAPPGERRTSTVFITGNGIPPRVTKLEASANLDNAIACAEHTMPIVLENTGNVTISVDSVIVELTDSTISVPGLPLSLAAGSSATLPLIFTPERGTAGPLTGYVYQRDTVLDTFEGVLVVETEAPTVSIAPLANVAAGSQLYLDIVSTSTTVRSVPESIVLDIAVSKERLMAASKPITATVTDASRTGYIMQARVGVTMDHVTVELLEPVTSPYEVSLKVPAIVLWKDPSETTVEVSSLESACADPAKAETRFSVDECAQGMRMVRFGALPIVRTRVVTQPVYEDIVVEFETTATTAVSVSLVTVSGQRILLANNFTLQKGLSHCKFSSSGRAAGIYGLVVTHGNGEEILPVVFVN